jgi:hypothetical protein
VDGPEGTIIHRIGQSHRKNKPEIAAPASPPTHYTRIMDNVVTDAFGNRTQLKKLRMEHRDLDVAITELSLIPHVDQLRIRRLKKQKLRLKDMISKLESKLIPDLNA